MSHRVSLPSYLQRFSLDGKTALITGATGGIGLGLVEALAGAGADLISLQLPTEPQTAKEIVESQGKKCVVICCDLLNLESLPQIVEEVFTVCTPDILVNCAGIFEAGPTVDFPLSSINKILNLNVTACMVLAQECAKRWLVQAKDRPAEKKIVNFASINAFQGNLESVAYATSKGGILQMTKAMSNEWAQYGIMVNSIAPGYTKTPMNKFLWGTDAYKEELMKKIPCKRWGTGADIAGTLIYLSSSASNYVTGTCAIVDGGVMADTNAWAVVLCLSLFYFVMKEELRKSLTTF